MAKEWVLKLQNHLRNFSQKIFIKVRLAQIRRTKVENFKDLGSAVFNLILNKVSDASKDPSVRRRVEELMEQDREIRRLNLKLKQLKQR